MDKEWLISKITVEEAEVKHMVIHEEFGFKPVPFGFSNDSWNNMLSVMKLGDELWEYSSPNHFWENLAGREGIALVRNGEIVLDLLTRMN